MRSLVVALLLLPAIALANEPTDPRAKAQFEAGLAAYEQKDFAAARRAFEAAYEIEQVATLLWSWAQAERLGGRCSKAIDLYRKFQGAKVTPTQSAAAGEMIAQCETLLAAAQPAPANEPLDAPRRRPWYRDPLAGGLTAGGLLGVGVGVTFLVLSADKEHEATLAPYLDEHDALLDQATARRRIGGASLALGIGAIAAGVTVYVLNERRQSKLTASTDGRAIYIGARF